MEHRWGHRFSVSIPVRLTLSSGVVVWGRIRDLSASGAFVESVYSLPLSALVTLELRNCPVPVLSASVVRLDAEGVGLEWCELGDAGPQLLAQYRFPPPSASSRRPLHVT